METDFINSKSINNLSSDRFSRFISSSLLCFSKSSKFNKISKSLNSSPSSPKFYTELLENQQISIKDNNFHLPETGSFIVLVPFISGFLEIFAAISSVIDKSQRDDIRIFPSEIQIQSIPAISPLFLNSSSDSFYSSFISSKTHLQNGGGILFFIKINPKDLTSESSIYSKFRIPIKMSKYFNSPLLPLLIDFEPSFFNSFTAFANDWLYTLFAFRRFFSESSTTVAITATKFLFFSSSYKDSLSELFDFYLNAIDDDNIKSIFNLRLKSIIVPRGTER